MTIAFCWFFPILLLSLPLTNLWGHFGLECGTKNCVIIQDDSGKKLRGFLGIFGFFLPLITLIICNIAIYIRVKVQQFFLIIRCEIKYFKLWLKLYINKFLIYFRKYIAMLVQMLEAHFTAKPMAGNKGLQSKEVGPGRKEKQE